MLMTGVSQIVHVEFAIPIADHRLMVIGPGFLTSHGLDAMHTHDGLQTAIVPFRTGDGLAGIMHHVAIVFDKSLHQLLVSHKHRSVLMPYGKTDGTRLILERLEVFCAMGAVNLMLVRVVVDVIPVAYLRRRGAFSKRLCKRLGCCTPRAIG